MTKTNTVNVTSILSTLSPAAAEALRSHFREEAVAEITSTLSGSAPKAATKRVEKTEKAEKRGPNRQHTADGRSASQFIRDCGEEMSAKDVVEAASQAGLTIEAPLVYNVRAQAKKKVEVALNEEEAAKKDEARKNVLRNNAEKARAARKAKIAEKKASVEVPETETETEAPAAEEAAPAEAPKAKGKKTAK